MSKPTTHAGQKPGDGADLQKFDDVPRALGESPMATMARDLAQTGIAVMEVDGTRTHRISPEDLQGFPMTEEEMQQGPLPEWAVGYAKGNYVLGAQLPTRDGRVCGNGHIVEIDALAHVYTVLTDAGSEMHCLKEELMELFYPPVWVSDVKEVIRKFSRAVPD